LKPRGPEQDLPDKYGFHEGSLSVIATILPSKKSFRPTGTLLENHEKRGG
jgi:hypothetical protein